MTLSVQSSIHRKRLPGTADERGFKRAASATDDSQGSRYPIIKSPERGRPDWSVTALKPLREAFQAAIQSAQAAGHAGWLAQ
jgi:hypothetical protein